MLSICVYCMLSLFALETDQQRANFLFFFKKKEELIHMVSFAHVVLVQPDSQVLRLSCLSVAAISVFLSFSRSRQLSIACQQPNAQHHASAFLAAAVSQTLSLTIRFDSIRLDFFFGDSRKRLQYKELQQCGQFSFSIRSYHRIHCITALLPSFFLCVYMCVCSFRSGSYMESIIMFFIAV